MQSIALIRVVVPGAESKQKGNNRERDERALRGSR